MLLDFIFIFIDIRPIINKQMIWKKIKNKKLSFFVSIGAGPNQIPLIKDAKKLGFNVIGVDANAMAPGFLLCDLKIQESIENHEEIYTKLREMLFDGDIAGIMTKSYGRAIVTTSFLCEKFNIPHLPYTIAESFVNKRLMKQTFKDHHILSPETIKLTSKNKDLPQQKFPMIVKAVTGHGKENVFFIDSNESLVSLKKKTSFKNMIGEKYIEGDEIIAVGLIHKNRYHLVEITDKERSDLPYFADIKHKTPSRYQHLLPEIQKIGQSVTNAFQLQTTPLIMELVLDSDDKLFLIEAVPEFGGEFLSDILIPARYQYDIITEAIKAITGKNVKYPQKKKNANAVVVHYITGKNGTLASCNPDGPKSIDGIIFARIFKEIGSPVTVTKTNHDRIGVIIATGKTLEAAQDATKKAIESFNIRIQN